MLFARKHKSQKWLKQKLWIPGQARNDGIRLLARIGEGVYLQKRSRVSIGFTIIEIIVTLLLLVLLVAVTLPSLNALTGVNLKKASSEIQGLVREVYGLAIFSGHTLRIVYDLEQEFFFVELSTRDVKLQGDKNKFDGKIEFNKLGKEEDPIEQNEGDDKKNPKRPVWQPVEGSLGEYQKLPRGVIFQGIWVEHLKERVREGKVAQYFFRSGYTQSAQITLGRGDEEQDRLTVIVEPLTGESYVEQGEPEIENN